MKHILRLIALSAVSCVWVAAASADIIVTSQDNHLNSSSGLQYISGPVTYCITPAGCSNTSPGPSTPQAVYNLGTSVSPWMSALSGSEWVSFDPNTYPGGSHDSGGEPNTNAPDGTYIYKIGNLGLTAGQLYSVTFSVLADDTTSVIFDGNQEIAPGSGEASHCVSTNITCTMVYNPGSPFMLTATGSDFLQFDVNQMFGSATGLDFVVDFAPVTPTPEPSSLMLLGTGLLGAAGLLRRRIRA